MRAGNQVRLSSGPWLVAILALAVSSCRHTPADLPSSTTGSHADDRPPERAPNGSPAEAPSDGNTRRALLVGINDYLYKDDIPQLHGTGNDVDAMHEVLVQRFGFPEANILVLKDGAATKAGVVNAFRRHLVDAATQSTVALFFYSGHGSQMIDTTGEEADGLDETLVMQDSGRSFNRENRDLSDKELNALLAELGQKTSHAVVIADSCHSGTVARAAGIPKAVKPDLRKRMPRAALTSGRGALDGASGLRSEASNYVLLAASRSSEFSYERVIDGKPMGALTWSLTHALLRSRSDETYRDTMERVALDVSAAFPAQHPNVEGPERDSVLFGTRRLEPTPFAEVRTVQGKPELQAGLVHGVTTGSTFNVYPPDTKKFPSAEPLATIVTDSVGTLTSEAHVTSGKAALPDGSRAIETNHHFDKVALHVAYRGLDQSKTLRDVQTALSGYKNVGPAPSANDYDVLLAVRGDGSITVERGTSDPKAVGIAGAGAVERIVEKVLSWAKWYAIKNIENEQLLSGDSPWDVRIAAKPAGGKVTAGDALSIVLTNNSNQRLYLSLLDLSFDGSVDVTYPPSGAVEFVEPGATWEKPLVACLPADQREPIEDIIKVFFTTEPADYSLLQHSAIKGIPADDLNRTSPLADALLVTAMGAAPRGFMRPVSPSTWATRQASFTVAYTAAAKPCDSAN